jgi:hypothetical protein
MSNYLPRFEKGDVGKNAEKLLYIKSTEKTKLANIYTITFSMIMFFVIGVSC